MSNSDASENSGRSGGRFRKGQSGNPGGRPKLEGEVRQLAQKHGPRAVRRLAKLIGSKNERVAVAACQAILDRAYGKPPLALANDPTNPLLPGMPRRVGIQDVPEDPREAARFYMEFMSGLISFEDGGPGEPQEMQRPATELVRSLTHDDEIEVGP